MRLEHREGSLSPSSAPAPTPPLAAFPPPRCPLPSSPCGHSHKFPSHFHLKGRASWPLSVGEYQVGEGLGAASLLRSPQPPGPGRPHADSPPTTSTICRRTGPRWAELQGPGWGAAKPPPLEGSGATQISIFSTRLGKVNFLNLATLVQIFKALKLHGNINLQLKKK